MKYLSREEQKQLLRELSRRKDAPRDFMIINLILNTGLRLGECSSLKMSDTFDHYLNRVKPYLTVRRECSKTKKAREIPLNSRIYKRLSQFIRYKKRRGESLDPGDPLFLSRKKNPISRRALESVVSKWLREAKIGKNKYSVHSLRHSFAMRLRESGITLERIRRLLGHNSISSTVIYIEPSREDLIEAVESLAK